MLTHANVSPAITSTASPMAGHAPAPPPSPAAEIIDTVHARRAPMIP